MSGGLDSSVVVALLVERGYDVIGLTLHMFREGSRCCSIEDVDRSRRLCDELGIHHSTVSVIEYFEDTIIKPFVDEYLRGRTPSPCVLCNQFVKFGALQDRALQLGCSHVATGHYVKVEYRDGRYRLLRATDQRKDQSYFLHRLSQDQLSRCLFPLESMTKDDVAAYSLEHDLPVSRTSKRESQDLCFVADDGHGAFIDERRPELKRSGDIVNEAGTALGAHAGIHHFTIGQRKGIGVAAPTRLYVQAIEPESNQIVVGERADLFSRTCRVQEVHWIAGGPPAASFACGCRLRYRQPAARADIHVEDDASVRLHMEEPQFAITPGQAAVFYDGDIVLGGGWIAGRVV